MSNSLFLINELEKLPLLNGRYEKIKCVNFDVKSGARRGCFSLVFQAFDRVEQKPVAIKFYDIDTVNLARTYRKESFRREHDILQSLLGKERCLQLESTLTTYDLIVKDPSGGVFTLPCEYFVVEWLDDEIDKYFLNQRSFEVADKLRLFNEILLAVEALHRNSVFHRDLKADNMRAYLNALKRIIVAIDLGTAARFSSKATLSDYDKSVGAPAYAPPESFCHFAGDREIAPYADVYAVGCLLFELFNADYFYHELHKVNPRYGMYIAAMESVTSAAADPQQRIELWKKFFPKYSVGLQPVKIEGVFNSVPPGIGDILNRILLQLTHPDFRRRPIKLEPIRQLLWSAIRCMENEKIYRLRLARMREQRKRRLEKIQQREKRVLKFIGMTRGHDTKSVTQAT